MCVDLACCLDTLEQDLVVVVQYPYHYSTDYAWYLVLRAHLSHLISKLTQIDKVSFLLVITNILVLDIYQYDFSNRS